MRKKILIYSDEGVSPYYLRHLMRWLREAPSIKGQFEIARVSGDFILRDPIWEDTTALLVIPGGADRPYHKKLHGLGTSRIYNYVFEGGKYLGICAGSYFGCKRLSFDEPDGSLYLEDRDLGFFPGRAVGPAYPGGFCYHSLKGVRAASINFTQSQLSGSALFNGGPYFEHADQYDDVCIEARYQDLPGQPAAILSRRIGKGMVVLSGLHIEYAPEHCQATEENVVIARETLSNENYALHQYKEDLLTRLLSINELIEV